MFLSDGDFPAKIGLANGKKLCSMVGLGQKQTTIPMNQPASHILMVGGDSALATTVSAALESDAVLRFARDTGEGMKILFEQPMDFVLVDLESARLESLEFLRRLRDNPPVSPPLVHAFTA